MSNASSNGIIPNGIIHNKDGHGSKLDNAKASDAANAAAAVLKPSILMPSTSTKIRGVDFNEYTNNPITVQQLTSHFLQTGFQASNLGRAIEIINNMVTRSTCRVNSRRDGNLEPRTIQMMTKKRFPRPMPNAPFS